jgi:hypothetical protein
LTAPIQTWAEMRDFAVSLNLPKVVDAVSWGNPNLKAHGKMWCWWSPYIEAAIFKGTRDEREILIQADPQTFVMHNHYLKIGLILVAAGRIDRDWAEARLRRSWRDMAPKRWLEKFDAAEI